MEQIESKYQANLLVVDDQPNNLRVLSAILGNKGYRVRKAIDGEAALNTIKFDAPDLILLDVKMPKIDGYTLCSILKENDETRDIPIIFLSALDSIEDKVKGFEVGGVDYIAKPFQVEDVLARVQHQLIIVQQRRKLYEHNQRLIEEINERKQVEGKLQFLLRTINLVSQAPNLDHAIKDVLAEVCKVINWDYGEAWIINPEGTKIQFGQAYYHNSDQALKEFHQASRKYSFAYGIKLIGQVWATQQIQWIEDIIQLNEDQFSRVKLIQNTGLRSVFVVPITLEGKVLVIMSFFKRTTLPCNPEMVELIKAVALELSGFISRKQTEEALKIANKELFILAHIDGLTKIANRRCFDQSLMEEWARMKREKLPLTLLLSDVDYFKLYNDYYGHQAGDECIIQVAQAIAKNCQRPADLVARYGGEEIAILLPNTDLEGGINITQQIQQEIAKIAIPHKISLVSNQVTLSIGIATMIPTNETLAEELIAAADQALYRAKAQGRNTYCIYSQEN